MAVAVVLCNGVVKMPNTFTNEEYADIHFANDSAMKMVGMLLWNTERHPHRKPFKTMHRNLRETGSFPRKNADREQLTACGR
jgi:hypothetical protein